MREYDLRIRVDVHDRPQLIDMLRTSHQRFRLPLCQSNTFSIVLPNA